MRIRILSLLVAAVAASLAAPVARAEGPDGVGASTATMRQALDRHTLRGLDGSTLSLGSLDGEVVVVNFWASWCKPCRKELPALNALHGEMAGQGGRVVAISIDHDARNAERFIASHRLGLPVYHDGPEGLVRTLDLQAIPFTLVLDRRGQVVWTASGADDASLEALRGTARRLMAARPVATRVTEDDSE